MFLNKIASRLIIFVSLFFCQGLYATVYYVDDNSNVGDIYTPNVTGVNSSSVNGSATAPFRTLKYALSRATNNDIIYVDAGTYTDHFIDLSLSGIKIIGAGKDKTIFNHQGITADNPLWFLTMSGTSFTMQDVTLKNYKSYGVLYVNCTSYSDSTRVKIENCLFESNENAVGLSNGMGGAVSVDMGNDFTGKPAVVTVNNCVFSNNIASVNGGAIYIEGKSRLLISGSSFCNNQTQGSGSSTSSNGGGAVFSDNSYTTIQGSTFYGNNADYFSGGYGGAVMSLSNTVAPNKTLYITGCSFGANNAQRGGGVFVGNRITATIENSLFYTNNATQTGGAIYMRDANTSTDPNDASSSSIVLSGTTIVDNTTSSSDVNMVGGLHVQMAKTGTSVTATNCIFWNNEHANIFNTKSDGTTETTQYVSLNNSIINPSQTNTYTNAGNVITSDPLFKNPSIYDYRLLTNSPAIAAGSSTSLPLTDMVGTSRSQADIGAYANGANTMLNSYECTANPYAGVNVEATVSSLCKGASSTLTASGAVSYSWSPATGLSATTGNIVVANPTQTTTYTVTGTMSNGTTKTNTITLTVNTPQSIIASTNTPTITRGSSSILTVNGSQTYTWSPSTGLNSVTGSSVIASPLQSTIYTVIGTDINGCQSSDTVKLNVVCDLILNVNKSQNNITVEVNNGKKPYLFSWSDGSTSQNRLGLSIGTYQLTVTDSVGCSKTASITISTDDFCSTFKTNLTSPRRGQITASVVNAPSSVTYSLNNAAYASTSQWTNLTAGTYIVSAKSGVCIAKDTLVLGLPTHVDTTNTGGTDTTQTTGGFGCTFTATIVQHADSLLVTTLNGKLPISLNWNDNTHLSARKITTTGTYWVSVTDANQCIAKDTLQVTDLTTGGTDSGACSTFKTNLTSPRRGQITASVVNAPSSVTYSLNNAAYASTSQWTNLTAGTYVVSAKSGVCIAKDTLVLGLPTHVDTTNTGGTDTTQTTGGFGCTFTATIVQHADSLLVTTLNGKLPISLNWNDNTHLSARKITTTGTYWVSVTDANQCIAKDTLQVTDLTTGGTDSGACSTFKTNLTSPRRGQITASVVNAPSSVTYSLNNAAYASTSQWTNLTAGTYIVSAKSGVCIAKDTLVLGLPTHVDTTNTGGTDTTQTTGGFGCTFTATIVQHADSLLVTTLNGKLPISLNWNDNTHLSARKITTTGTYWVSVTDANQCIAKDTLQVTDLTTGGTDSGACSTFKTNLTSPRRGQITASVVNAPSSVTYSLNNAAYVTTSQWTNLTAGTYVVSAKSGVCIAKDTLVLGTPTHVDTTNTGGTDTTQTTGGFGCTFTATIVQHADSLLVTTLNGKLPISLNWNDNTHLSARKITTTGTYWVSVTDANQCIAKDTLQVTDLTTGGTGSGACSTFKTNLTSPRRGQITASVVNAPSSVTYSLNNAAYASTSQWTNLTAGTYIVSAKSGVCIAKDTLVLGTPTHVDTTNTGGTDTTQTTGGFGCTFTATIVQHADSLLVTTLNGKLPISLNWNDNTHLSARKITTTGTYWVSVTDANQCIAKDTLQVTTVNIDTISAICKQFKVNLISQARGQIVANLSGNYSGVVYTLNGVSTTKTSWKSLTPGQYIVSAWYQTCVAKDTLVLNPGNGTVNTGCSMSVVSTKGIGTISLTVLNGTSPLNYKWNDGVTTKDRVGLTQGDYKIIVTDKDSCIARDSIHLDFNCDLSIDLTSTNISCFGNNDGTADVTINSGIKPYIVKWNGQIGGTNKINLAPGKYVVSVTDVRGCLVTDSVQISSPQQLVASSNVVSNSVNIQVVGGTLPYSYLWNTKSKDSYQNNLKPGTYSVIVTDAKKCRDTISSIVIDPSSLVCNIQVSESLKDAPCKSKSGGSIELTVTGTQGNVTNYWLKNGSPYSFTEDLYTISAGNYTYSVVDERGCMFTKNYVINEPSQELTTGLISTNNTISVSAQGGTPVYKYQWSTGGTSMSVTGLPKGEYTVVTTDSKGCQSKNVFNVDSLGHIPTCTLSVVGSLASEKCYGDATGSISLQVSGGQSPYTYEWSNNATTSINSGLSSGNYSVILRDNNGCIAYKSFTLTSPQKLDAVVDVENFISDVTVVGGTPGYAYLWSNGSTNSNEKLNIGSYSLTIYDANNCSTVIPVVVDSTGKEIDKNPACDFELSLRQQSVTCQGGNDGKLSVIVNKGVGPFTYEWNTGSQSSEITNLSAGEYTVYVGSKENPACTKVKATAIVTEPSQSLNVSITVSNFIATAQVSGGNYGTYTYLWSTGATTKQTTLGVGTSYLTVKDVKGCQNRGTVVVNTNGMNDGNGCLFTINGTVKNNDCEGLNEGEVDLTISPSGNYSILWSNGSTVSDISELTTGKYTVVVKDKGASQCSAEKTFEVKNKFSSPTISILVSNGVASVDVLGISPYSYDWSTGSNSDRITSLEDQKEYNVTVTDSTGCKATSSFVYDKGSVSNVCNLVGTIQSTNAGWCKGETTGSASIQVTGGTAPYSYDWSNGSIDSTIQNVNAGVYYLTVTDSKSCKLFKKVNIGESTSTFDLSINVDKTIPQATVTVQGAKEPLTYVWNTGAITQSISNLQVGNYNVLVTDALGCSGKTGFTYTGTSISCDATIKATPTSPKCFGGNDGLINLDVKNASSPITYLWSNGATTKSISGLTAGDYSVIVKYGNGCSISTSTKITNPASELVLSIVRVSDTQAEAVVNGGLKPYSYHWAGLQNNATISVEKGNSYTCNVTDALGCVKSAILNLEDNVITGDDFTISMNHQDESCYNKKDGEASVDITGNTGPYQVLWSNGLTSSAISNLAPGTYTVEVTDIEKTTRSASVTIYAASSLLNSDIELDERYICGTSSVEATINTSASNIVWSNGETTSTIHITQGGTYNVTVIGQNGCKEQSDDVVVIDKTPNSTLLNGSNGSICAGNAMTLTAASKTGPYDWKFNGQSIGSTRSIEVKTQGIYTLNITANGCSSSTNFQLNYKPASECTDNVTGKPTGLCEVVPSKEVTVDFEELCRQNLRNIAKFNAQTRLKYIQDSLRNDFEHKYVSKCMNVYENFTMTYTDKEHHYTLYYYDNAGNLVRTVPPQGVELIKDAGTLAKIKDDRFNNQRNIFTNHSFATTYKYNSLNQLVSQDVPDNERMDIVTISAADNGIPTTDKTIQAQMTASNHGFMLTQDATNQTHLYTTQNGGTNWDEASLVGKSDLNAVQMFDHGTIYAVGTNGVFVSMTPGNGQEVFLPKQVAENVNLKALYFKDVKQGLVFAEDGTIWMTADLTNPQLKEPWKKITALQAMLKGQLKSISFNNTGQYGYAISNKSGVGYVYRTSDEGLTWVELTNFRTNQKMTQVQMISEFNGFAVGEDGTLLSTTNKGQDWQYVATGVAGTINQVNFISNTDGYLVDASGLLYKTADGGTSWELQTLSFPVTKIVKDYYIGLSLLSGDGNMYKSTDNGITWSKAARENSSDAFTHLSNGDKAAISVNNKIYTFEKPLIGSHKWEEYGTISLPTDASQTSILNSTYKINQNTLGITSSVKGVQLRSNNKIYYSLNGKNYISANIPDAQELFTTMQVSKDGVGYAVSKTGKVITTSDFGKTWNNSSTITLEQGELINDLSVNTTMVAVGSQGTIWQKQPGDNSWNSVEFSLSPSQLNSVGYVSISNVNETSDKVVLAGVDGRIYTSEDGGASFITAKTNNREAFTSLYFDGSKLLLGSSKGNIYNSTFDVLSLNKEYSLSGKSAITSLTKKNDVTYAIDLSGNVYNSTVKGTWNKESINSTTGLNAIAGVLGNGAVCVGNKGTIFRKLEAGTTWNNVSATFPKDIVTYSVTESGIGYFVSASKKLYISKDGGATVSEFTGFSFPENVVKIEMTNETTGNFISNTGIYRLTINQSGAAQVTQQNSGLSNAKDLFVGYGKTGVVVAGSGAIYYSTDGGNSWNNSVTDVYTQLNAVSMVNNKVGYAVGSTGTILKTSNGGASWVKLTNNGKLWMNTSLTSVYFMDENNGYVAGANNLIYKTDDAGASFAVVQKNGLGTQGNITSLVKNGENGMMILGDGSQSATNYVDDMSLYGSRFWYDRLGRLTISQNSKQLNKGTGAYSYTIYDKFGKITEVGEITNRPTPTFEITNDDTKLKAWIAGGTKTEITRTYYNFQVFDVPGFIQENLRTRVSSTTYQDVDGTGYDYATHYSYDIHGNVSSLMQDNPKLVHLNQRFKKVDYEYDLISGKVNNVVYQKGAVDEFRHKYEYDADNKLTNVFTSRDNIVWDQDAKYYYYQHGPLSRVEIGHDKVQGMDYAYNLQGWLKAVNSTTLDEQNEMGHDGANLVGNLHKNFAKDEFGFSLGYYKEDYKSIGRPMSSDELFMASMQGSEIEQNNKDLYNGNISTMVTSVRKFMQGANASPMANQYTYDQLNRLKSVTTYQDPNVLATNQWTAGGTKQNAYSEKFTYDANGNIMTLKRNADVNANATSTGMDDFTYIYENKANGFDRNTNKLIAVKDATVTANNPATKNWGDIQPGQQYSATNKSLNNYQYDEIGNLIKDQSEEIYNIKWTVSGKIKSIERNANSKRPDLEFGYDAAGNRIYKIVKPRTGSGLTSETEWTTTYYTRDASGNQMAVYEMKTISDPDGTLNDQMQMKEFDIYGSSRLGVYNVPLEQANIAFAPTQNRGYLPSKYDQNSLFLSSTDALVKSYGIGYKFFEQSNHLGNVHTVVSDKKIAIDNNNDGVIDGYMSEVISANDYMAFGSLRPSRSYQSDAYRFSFQKQESDEELFGEGNSYFFKYRLEDSRTGRFNSVDPLTYKYPYNSPFAFSENRLIDGVELEGLEVVQIGKIASVSGLFFLNGSTENGIAFGPDGVYAYNSTGGGVEFGTNTLKGGWGGDLKLSVTIYPDMPAVKGNLEEWGSSGGINLGPYSFGVSKSGDYYGRFFQFGMGTDISAGGSKTYTVIKKIDFSKLNHYMSNEQIKQVKNQSINLKNSLVAENKKLSLENKAIREKIQHYKDKLDPKSKDYKKIKENIYREYKKLKENNTKISENNIQISTFNNIVSQINQYFKK